MAPLIVPDGRGKACKITTDIVRQIVEVAKEVKSKGRRIRLKSFTKQLAIEEDIVFSRKKIGEILIANGLYKPEIRRRRPKFYQSLRQNIPNGLVSVDGSEFTVWIDHVPYTFTFTRTPGNTPGVECVQEPAFCGVINIILKQNINC